VSARAGTIVEILSPPAAFNFRALCSSATGSLVPTCARFTGGRFPHALTHRGLVEQFQTFFHGSAVLLSSRNIRRDHANGVARSDPFKFIAGPNTVAVGDGLGNRQLQLAGDLRHVLTVARRRSLFKAGCRKPHCAWPCCSYLARPELIEESLATCHLSLVTALRASPRLERRLRHCRGCAGSAGNHRAPARTSRSVGKTG